jgi:hypothetical protein
MSIVALNNTEYDKMLFTNKIINSYENNGSNELDKILLINAFNEWGENMTFEPGEKYGYYNMNLLTSLLYTKKSKTNIVVSRYKKNFDFVYNINNN